LASHLTDIGVQQKLFAKPQNPNKKRPKIARHSILEEVVGQVLNQLGLN
jgi:hypothetical protein